MRMTPSADVSRTLPHSGAASIPPEHWRALPAAFIGAGAAGTALARAWQAAGGRIVAVASRSAARAEALVRSLNLAAPTAAPTAAARDARIVVLAVPDGAIAEVAAAIPWRPGQIAVHLSGALGLDPLAAACERGAEAVALHPLCAFTRGDGTLPAGIRFGYTGPAALQSLFAAIAHDLGGVLLPVPEEGRTLYHAAAVLASNDLVALAAAAVETLERAGIAADEALAALLPLIQSTVDNLARQGLPGALTGPLVRGDLTTMQRHRAALAGTTLLPLYDALATQAARLALARDDTPASARAALASLAEGGTA
jgi:predicted short-subunit dehydrogenase-like oxidoreductase (DUF2520 family)